MALVDLRQYTPEFNRRNGIELVMPLAELSTHIDRLKYRDGLEIVQEDPRGAYCALSLTGTPALIREPVVEKRQELLKGALRSAGIDTYDPKDAPYSPFAGLAFDHKKIFGEDSTRVVAARFLTGLPILPSTGFGEEIEMARNYNKFIVLFMDKNIRISRMLPPQGLYFQYDKLENRLDEITEIFHYLQRFTPVFARKNGVAIPAGMDEIGRIHDLGELLYSTFPHMEWKYDGKKPIVDMSVINPGIFYEFE